MDMSTPVIVPFTTLPFLSSMVTLSLLSFIRKRTSFIVAMFSSVKLTLVKSCSRAESVKFDFPGR